MCRWIICVFVCFGWQIIYRQLQHFKYYYAVCRFVCATFNFVHKIHFLIFLFCLTTIQCSWDGTGGDHFTFVTPYDNTISGTFKNPVTNTYEGGKNTHHQHKIAFYFNGGIPGKYRVRVVETHSQSLYDMEWTTHSGWYSEKQK